MSLKRRIGKLEKAVGVEDPEKAAAELVRFGIEYGIIPENVDFESAVKAVAEEGLSIGKIIREMHAESEGLPKLPCEQEDVDYT